MASNPGDVVLDVFGGSGSTYHAAQLHERRWIGCEVGDVTAILQRLETVFKLDPRESIDYSLRKCFKSAFIRRELAMFLGENRMARLRGMEPFNDVVSSFQEYASKSRIIDVSAKEGSE